MDKIKLKRLMTDLAKGSVTQKEVDMLVKPKKVSPGHLKTPNNTHKRTTKTKGGKK